MPWKAVLSFNNKNTGIGSYDLTITRGDSLTGGLEYLPATLHRGKLSLAQEFWSYPMANAFTRGVSYSGAELQKENLPDTVAYLKTIPDYVNVKAALSFQKDLSMEELAALQMKDQNSLPILWVAVRNANYYRNAEIGTETTDSSADVTGATVQMNDSFPCPAFCLKLVLSRTARASILNRSTTVTPILSFRRTFLIRTAKERCAI